MNDSQLVILALTDKELFRLLQAFLRELDRRVEDKSYAES